MSETIHVAGTTPTVEQAEGYYLEFNNQATDIRRTPVPAYLILLDNGTFTNVTALDKTEATALRDALNDALEQS